MQLQAARLPSRGAAQDLFIYGDLNRVQSSSRLERECQRIVESVWLPSRLGPDFETIAEFGRSRGDGVRKVCHRFTLIRRDLDLVIQAVVVTDSSKFKAVNNGDNDFTSNSIALRQEQPEQRVQRYLGGGGYRRSCLASRAGRED
ncbi:hypothetical protein PQQ73_18215 [Paraburkholderia strydomiana]|uniref:Uncharacterized protein n=1 Tax=Paraburkholderia strydomiana TaxID=1245417 RepID=A0ABW9EGV4_9BURK